MTEVWTYERRRWNFWKKVVHGPNGCWLWTGSTRRNGYGSTHGRTAYGRSVSTAHRWAYEDQIGPIPDGHEIDHLCGVRNCVRPDHLEAVTLQENRRRRDIGYRPEISTVAEPIPSYPEPELLHPRRRIVNGKVNPLWTEPEPKASPTHCKHGHEYAVVGWAKNGRARTCAACRSESTAKRKAKTVRGPRHGTETHCPHGHPYAPENIYWHKQKDGSRHRECKACVNARNLANYHRRARAAKKVQSWPDAS